MINSCQIPCNMTYYSCFDGCNEDETCETDCLSDQTECYDDCESDPNVIIYAGNIHNFLWGGSLYEPETDLYWMRNRYYHVDMHRFINQDPIGIWGDANNLGNGFAYVAGMVIEATDPTGLQLFEICPGLENATKEKQKNDLIAHGFSEEAADYAANAMVVNVPIGFEAMLVAIETFYRLTDKEVDALNKKQNSHKPDDIILRGDIKDASGKVIGEFVVRHDRSGTSKVKTKDGREEIDFVVDANGDVILKEKRVYDKKGKLVAKYKWVTDANGKNGHWELVESSSGMPVDDEMNKMQSFFAKQFLKKMLEAKKRKNKYEQLENLGPIIEVDDNGRKIFIFNPFYRGKDPMKEIIWKIRNDDGTLGFVRNPFAPGAEYGYDSTTYEKFKQKGFVQPEVDPYYQ